jgi:hypothetical protein
MSFIVSFQLVETLHKRDLGDIVDQMYLCDLHLVQHLVDVLSITPQEKNLPQSEAGSQRSRFTLRWSQGRRISGESLSGGKITTLGVRVKGHRGLKSDLCR